MVKRVRRMCRESRVIRKEPDSGGKGRSASEVRTEMACYLSRETGISMAGMAGRSGGETSDTAMTIERRNSEGRKL